MKYRHILASLLFAGTVAVPAVTAGPLAERAVSLAAQKPTASLDDVCLATYKAVKESPEEADAIFSQVIGQRAKWTPSEVYAILRSVLLARPDLAQNINQYVLSRKDGEPVNPDATALDPMAARLLKALPADVAQTVLNNLNRDAAGLVEINENIVHGNVGSGVMGVNTNDSPAPTPGPISSQN